MSKPYIAVEIGARLVRYDPEIKKYRGLEVYYGMPPTDFGGVIIVTKIEDLPEKIQ